MEQEVIKKSIIERFNSLQPEIQQAVMDSSYENYLSEIVVKHNLTKEQAGELEIDTTLVMLGQTHPNQYEKELLEDLRLAEWKTKELVSDVNEKILKNIRDLLVKNFDEEEMVFDPSFSFLPENIQLAIANSDWREKLSSITNKYKLPISQMGILEEATIKLISSEIPTEKYEEELIFKMRIPRQEISNIVKDVNEGILMSIRKLMQNTPTNNEVQIESSSVEINIDEEIPLPPYAKTITNDKLLISNEEKIPESYKPTEISIENVSEPKEEPKNIVEEKLKGATISKHDVSDYSTPKVNTNGPEKPLPRSFDPYREAF